jgi:hypothetical protein
VFVFGDDGASFDFVEHLQAGEENTVDDVTVVMSGYRKD